MASTKQLPALLLLPREIREHVYHYLLAELDLIDARIANGSFGNFSDYPPILRIYLNMLRVNRQIHEEFLDAFCSRTWTIFVNWKGVRFRGRHYRRQSKFYNDEIDQVLYHSRSSFPTSFPFYRVKQLRIKIQSAVNPYSDDGHLFGTTNPSYPWEQLGRYLQALGGLLKDIASRHRSCKKFLLDVDESTEPGLARCCDWEHRAAWCYDCSRAPSTNPRDIRNLLEPLERNVRNFEICDLRLGGWIVEFPEIMTLAQDCGRAMLERSDASEKQEFFVESGNLEDVTTSPGQCRLPSSTNPVIDITHTGSMVVMRFEIRR